MRTWSIAVALVASAVALAACGQPADTEIAAPVEPVGPNPAIVAPIDTTAAPSSTTTPPEPSWALTERLLDGVTTARSDGAAQLGVATADAIRQAVVASLPVPAPPPSEAYFDEELVDLGRIVIPALGIDRILHQGISLHNIDRGPSHWPGTAAPGEIGNVVIAGHRTTHGAPFRNIDQLVPGDQVIFEVGGEVSVYVVSGDEVVTARGLHIVDQTAEQTATLFACHPPGSAQYRYVVHLELDPDAVVELDSTDA